MIQLTTKDDFLKSYHELFIWVLPILFFLFVIWDKLKSMEYSDTSPDDQNIEDMQRTKTWLYFGLTIAQMIGFLIMSSIFNVFNWTTEYLYIIFTVTTLLLSIFYRIWKYDIKKERIS